MSDSGPSPGELETAALIAAMLVVREQQEAAVSVPPTRPLQGRWVMSGRPRPVAPPFTARPVPHVETWSSDDDAPGR